MRARRHCFHSLFLPQGGNEGGNRVEQVTQNREDAGARLPAIQRHERCFGIAVEGDDAGPRTDVVEVLRGAADAESEQDLWIDTDARLANLAIQRQQVQLFSDFARSADHQAADAKVAQGLRQRLNDSLVAVAIAEAETNVDDKVRIRSAEETR